MPDQLAYGVAGRLSASEQLGTILEGVWSITREVPGITEKLSQEHSVHREALRFGSLK